MIIICIYRVHLDTEKLIMRNRHSQKVMSSIAALPMKPTIAARNRKSVFSNGGLKCKRRNPSIWWPPVFAFKPSERIVLRSARRLSAIHSAVPFQPSSMDQMRAEIINAVGSGFCASLAIREGQRAAEQLEMILRTFCCAGYRPLKLRPICEYRVCPDERFLLSFIAGCQREDLYNVQSILSWLAPSVSATHLILSGKAFADMLKNSGIILPQRLYLSGRVCQSQPILSANEQAFRYH